tara:strand:- start:1667 stop:2047 length:381 start_codon:yes stop_codon:yes gene_type:complete
MKLSAFEKIIRKVVREEIDHALRREIALLKEELNTQPQQRVIETKHDPIYDVNPQEAENFRAKLREQMPPPNFNTGNDTLNSLLSETAMAPTPEQVFADNDPVNQFVNKDWSPVMNAIEKKKDFRP